ncbi:MAG TPA: FHA domain-containing protein [Acidimicrobiales bacterium]|nr:FHA domain-containing protein [Acidimicrobiales bacterium]
MVKLLLDDFRLCIRPGRGLVARFPAAVLVITANEERLPGLDRLVEECRNGAGRDLTGRLADLIEANPDKTPPFCALYEEGDGLTFFVHGDTQIVLTGAQPVMRMAGRGTAGWTGELHDRVASIAIGPAPASSGEWPPLAGDELGDLREGVVPGGAVLLVPRAATVTPSAPPPARLPEATPPPARVPEAAPPPRSVPAPTAVGPESPTTAPPAAIDGPPVMVWGVHCKRGHFNNPDARYCRLCGTHMVHQRRDPVLGPRPVLGFLVVDDGATYKLDADYVLGQDPDLDAAVAAGEARGLALSDPEGTVSPSHAAVKLEDWNVFLIDLNPRFGTHIWRPGTDGWVRLEPGQKVMLEPRSHILLGRRTLVFDSVNRR